MKHPRAAGAGGHGKGPQPCRLRAPVAFHAATRTPRAHPSLTPGSDALTASLTAKGDVL